MQKIKELISDNDKKSHRLIMETLFVKNPNVKWKKVEKKIFFYLYKNGDWRFFELNASGYEIWELCNKRKLDDIVSILTQKYKLPKKGIKNIIKNFLSKLLKEGLVETIIGKDSKISKRIEDANLLRAFPFKNPQIKKFSSKTIFSFISPTAGLPRFTAITHSYGPLYIYFEITSSCNLHCRHCYIEREVMSRERDLSLEEVKQVIDKLTRRNIPVKILFLGGEPFMRRDFFDILTYAKRKGIVVDIATNGWLLNKRKIKKLKKIGVDGINITLYDTTGKFDEIFSQRGHFKKMIKILKIAKRENLPTDICFVMTRVNFWELFKVYNLARKLNVKRFDINVYMPIGPASQKIKKKFQFTPFQTLLFWVFIEPFILRQLKNPPVEASRCYPGDFPCIKPNGDVTPCNGAPSTLVVGNILRDDLDILCKRLRVFATKWDVEPCSYCPFKKVCIGGCKVAYELGNISCPIGIFLKKLRKIYSFLIRNKK